MSAGILSRLAARRPSSRLGLTFVAGLLAGLAFAPAYLVPLWPLGFALTLVLIYQAQTWPLRLGLSFLFSYGYMLTGLYWVSLAPTASPEFYFTIPFALLLLPAVTAVFGTLALFLAGFWRGNPLSYGLCSAGLWLFFEWRRGIDLTGAAWNRVGMIWTWDALPLQIAALGGVPLLSALTLLCGLAAFLIVLGRRPLGLGLLASVLVVTFTFGALRLWGTPIEAQATLAEVQLRLVQSNIPKNTFSGTWVYEEHLRRSTQSPLEGISHVIWPEGSVRAHLDQQTDLRADLAAHLAPAPYSLVFGRRWADSGPDNPGGAIIGAASHLSAYLIDHSTLNYAAYDKTQLVPFGEYIPYAGLFDRLGFSPLTGQLLSRVPGDGPRTLSLPGSPPVGVFICYDSLFSGRITDPNDRPLWLATLTEDAWYILPDLPWLAHTPGPYQHLAESRLRAVEEGLAVARASNPGISLVFDPFGRVWSDILPLNAAGFLDSSVPAPRARPLFSRLGYSPVALGLVFLFLLAALLTCGRSGPEPLCG